MSKERSLQLKFLDEVCGPVLTGKAIRGKGGTPVRVALVDNTTGQIIQYGPESSAKVEILVLDASGDDNERDLSLEDFNKRIIREGDKKKPHFAKSNYIYLNEGVGILCNAKLGHDSRWMKCCKCRLGARIVGNFGGIEVRDASTESFMVLDSRSKLYEKHYPPSLSDHVWRLENIGKDGPPCKRLNEKNVFTVRDFLFLLSIDPQRLQKIVGAGAKTWKATVDHARTCIIDDKRICSYYPSSEYEMGVIYDVVGGLKGLIHDSHYIPINNLSGDEKDCAHKLLLSAFENQKDINFFHDETSLLHQFPLRSSDDNATTNSSIIQESSDESDLIMAEKMNGYDATEPCASSQSINLLNGSTSSEQLYDPYLVVPNQMLSPQFSDLDHLLEHFGDNETLMSLFLPESNNLSEILRAESNSQQQSNAGCINLVGAVAVMLWMFRARKRVIALGGTHVQKRQRT
ncbi:hypothetical protein DH2020_019343 [Rehmannia glutinosa]|uniref:Uncharacterized protein n=1 Tax=Rehmannia glutinosa TaxID=99300 RepID=A0ABR0WLJ7_REHGL